MNSQRVKNHLEFAQPEHFSSDNIPSLHGKKGRGGGSFDFFFLQASVGRSQKGERVSPPPPSFLPLHCIPETKWSLRAGGGGEGFDNLNKVYPKNISTGAIL